DHEVRAGLLVRGLDDPDVGDRKGVEAIAEGARIAAALRRDTAREDHLHIRLPQPGTAHALHQNLPHLLPAQFRRHPVPGPTALKAVEMIVEAEELAVPNRDD